MNSTTDYAQQPLPKQLRDRDIFQDIMGRVFVVLGHIQPDERILSFLKYLPDPGGQWARGNTRYQRVFWGSVTSVIDSFSQLPAEYITHDTHFGTDLLEVPRNMVTSYFRPEARLQEIFDAGPQDPLEARAMSLAEALHDVLGIHMSRIGVTGSVLWKAHNPQFSDLNMNVYGLDTAWRLHHSQSQLEGYNGRIALRRASDWENAIRRLLSRATGLTQADLSRLFSRKTAVYYDGFCVGIIPVLEPTEAPIRHGSEQYHTVTERPVRVRIEIESDKYGLFTPSIYSCSSQPIDQYGVRVTRLIIYEGAFRGLLVVGDQVDVSGTLQCVTDPSGKHEPFYQLMIGTKTGHGEEFIRLVG